MATAIYIVIQVAIFAYAIWFIVNRKAIANEYEQRIRKEKKVDSALSRCLQIILMPLMASAYFLWPMLVPNPPEPPRSDGPYLAAGMSALFLVILVFRFRRQDRILAEALKE